jgi:hypothetical protein
MRGLASDGRGGVAGCLGEAAGSGGDRGALMGEFGVAVVNLGQGGGDVVAVDGGEDRAGAEPAVSGGEDAEGAESIDVVIREDAVVVRGALGGRQESHSEVVAYLLLRDPG